MFLSISMVTPLTPEFEPPINPDTGSFFYTPSIVNGLPWWAFKSIMMCIVPTVLLLVAIYKIPNEFPVDKKKIETEGYDPDLVELTKKEMMGKRESYDSTNELVRRRRSSISNSMRQLGLSSHHLASDKTEESTPFQQHLSSMVLKRYHEDTLMEDDNIDDDDETFTDMERPLEAVTESSDTKEEGAVGHVVEL